MFIIALSLLVYVQIGNLIGMHWTRIPMSIGEPIWLNVTLWLLAWPIFTGIYICDRTAWRNRD